MIIDLSRIRFDVANPTGSRPWPLSKLRIPTHNRTRTLEYVGEKPSWGSIRRQYARSISMGCWLVAPARPALALCELESCANCAVSLGFSRARTLQSNVNVLSTLTAWSDCLRGSGWFPDYITHRYLYFTKLGIFLQAVRLVSLQPASHGPGGGLP